MTKLVQNMFVKEDNGDKKSLNIIEIRGTSDIELELGIRVHDGLDDHKEQ